MKTTTKQLQAVQNFMKVGGQVINTVPTVPTTKVGLFRIRLINEEINGKNELVDSIKKDEPIGIIDGLCDILYVAYGAMATFGTECNEYSVDYAGAKGEYNTIPLMHIAHKHTTALHNYTEQLNRGLLSADMFCVQKALNGIVDAVYTFGEKCNYDLSGAFEEVHNSNMSKFCTTAQEAHATIAEKSKTDERYSTELNEVHEVQVQGKSVFVIKRTDDGKILKGSGFFEPDLSKYIINTRV